MLTLGGLTFAVPWALLGLALLPALWWLLRVTPPSPKRVTFPPIRFLAALVAREETAVRTPLWLILLRLLLVLLVVLAAAHPLFGTGVSLGGSGPLVLVVDNGWAAARFWRDRMVAIETFIQMAERDDRPVILVTTAATPSSGNGAAGPGAAMVPAATAGASLDLLKPLPWSLDRGGALVALEALHGRIPFASGQVIWLSDGLEPAGNGPSASDITRALGRFGEVTLLAPEPQAIPWLLRQGGGGGAGDAELALVRAAAGGEESAALRFQTEDGSLLARQDVRFAKDDLEARTTVSLPPEWVRRLTRIDIEGQETAGAVALIDDSWRRRPVGLLETAGTGSEQPLLAEYYYVERALDPIAEIRRGDAEALLGSDIAVLVMGDTSRPDAETAATLGRWIESGGVLLRFAGPRLAATPEGDDLMPVALRGDRTIGGAMAWGQEGRLAPFDPTSPFAGLGLPQDVRIDRQVLAEPSIEDQAKTWARLDDGTPLITGARRGDGWLVLVHTTANAEWSNLPLSGLFVDLVGRIVDLGRGGLVPRGGPPLLPIGTLDGFGRIGAPPADVRPIEAEAFASTVPGPRHPPGIYGTGDARAALNLAPSIGALQPIANLPGTVTRVKLGEIAERDLTPPLLTAALVLAVLDLVISLVLRGLLPRTLGGSLLRRARTAATRISSAVLVTLLATAPGRAESVLADGTAPPSSLETRLAYLVTGAAETDRMSEAGLHGLTLVVNRRTAAELASPAGVNPETDELAFYPLIYWPLPEGGRNLSPIAVRRLVGYMRHGGTIVFDSRSRMGGDERADLRKLARALDLPPLIPVPTDHVLRRSYYLLADMPGRWTGGTVWVQSQGEHVNDGVTAVIAGSNDWAGAWAVDEAMRPLLAVVPDGERQREAAYRFGINLVIHVLTGNYKGDQVHLPAILERLSQ